jgi:hypothetical protein
MEVRVAQKGAGGNPGAITAKVVTVPMVRLELAEAAATTVGASNPLPRRKIQSRQARQAAYSQVMFEHSTVIYSSSWLHILPTLTRRVLNIHSVGWQFISH